MRTLIILLLSAFSLSACTPDLRSYLEEPLRTIAGEELAAITTIGTILEDGTLNASDVEVLVPTEEIELVTGVIADVQMITDRYTADRLIDEAIETAARTNAAIGILSDEIRNLQAIADPSFGSFDSPNTTVSLE